MNHVTALVDRQEEARSRPLALNGAISPPRAEDEVDFNAASLAGLLASRARVAMWIVIASNLLFALTDLRLGAEALKLVAALKLLQVACAALGLSALRVGRSRRAVIAIVLCEAAVVSALTAWSGAVADDIVITMILWIAVPFGATVLLPWGALPQLGLVVIAASAMVLNVWLARGSLEAALHAPSVGVLLIFAATVALARESERQRRVLARENARRSEAEEDLRRTLEGLDQQVRERTRSLETTNVELREARETAEAAKQRFGAISRLTSDYAYSVRVLSDLTSVTEWLTEASLQRVTGYGQVELSAKGGGLALVHPDDLPIAIRRLEVLLGGDPDVTEFRIIRKDGAVRWIREHGYPEFDAAEGRVVRILGAAVDITAQRTAEEQLSETLRQRENVMNTVPDVIYTLGRDGRMLDWNQRLEIVTGRSADQIRRESAAELFALPDRAAIAAAIRQAVAKGYAEVEVQLIVPTGVRPYQFTGAPLRDEQGAVVGITGVGRDISELKELQRRTATLLEVSRDISGPLDLESILDQVQRRVCALLPCDMVATSCWDPQEKAFRIVSHHGVPEPLATALAGARFPLGVPFGGRVAAGESFVLEDARQLPMIGPLLPAGPLVVAPLRVRGAYLGTLMALRATPGSFAPHEVALCEGIGAQLAIAIESSELDRSQRDEGQIAGALARVGRELISALDSPRLLHGLCDLSTEVLGCDAVGFLLWRPAEERYSLAAICGLSDEQREFLAPMQFPAEAFSGLLVALAGEEVVEVDLASPPSRWAGLPAQHGFAHVLYAALRRGRETVGFLCAGVRTPGGGFTPVQKRITAGIAQLASFALERAQAMEALEEASRLKSEFVATMSHELRTPLNIMLGYNEMLRDGAVGPLSLPQSAIVERSDKSARELFHLITEILDLSRLESGRVILTWSEVSIAELFAELDAETHTLRAPSVEIAWEVPEDLPPLWADRGKLKVVVKNLLTNAYKFTDAGRITLRVTTSEARMEIAVEDTGMGIPAPALGYIFEPFRQVNGSATGRHSGVGLGLHIVHRLIDLMRGTIEVRSEVGVGTVFRIGLPLGRKV